MASVSRGTRQKAVIGASQAMLGSLGFFVREALPISKQSSDLALSTSIAASNLNNALLAYLELFEEAPLSVKTDPREELDKAVVKIKKRAFDLAALGFVIPLLLNKDAREYLSSFAGGLIGVENVEKFKLGLIAVTGVVTGVFTFKLIKQVGDSIEAVKRLSQVVGTLFGITEAATEETLDKEAELDKQKKDIEAEKKKKEAEDRRLKDAGKKGVNDIKASKQEYKKANFLGKIKFLATKFGPKVLGAVVKSIPVVGAAATIGLLIAEIAGFFSDDEEQEKENIPEARPGVASSSSATPAGHSAQEVVKTIQAEKPAAPMTSQASKPPAEQAPVQSGSSAAPSSEPASDKNEEFDSFLKKKMSEAVDFQEGKVDLDGKAIEKKAEVTPPPVSAPVVESKPSPAATDTFNKTPGGKDLPKGVTRDPMSGAYIFNGEMFAAGSEDAFNARLKAYQTGKSVTYIDDDRNVGKVKKTFDPKTRESEILGPADSGESIAKDSEEIVSKKKQSKSKILVVNNIDNKVVTAASKE
jgi:hypothetical protein